MEICKTPILNQISTNSSVTDVLTPCFAFIFLPFVLMFFTVLCFLFLTIYGIIFPSKKLQTTKLLFAKSFFGGLICIVCFIRSVYSLWSQNGLTDIGIGAISNNVIALLSFLTYLQCWKNGIMSSIWLHFVYFLRFLIMIPESVVVIYLLKLNLYFIILLGTEAIVVITQIILFCFVDICAEKYELIDHTKKPDPDRKQSSLGRVLFMQAGHLMSKGYKGELDYKNFWSLDIRNQPKELLKNYQKFLLTTKPKMFSWLFVVLMKCTWLPVTSGMLLYCGLAFITAFDPLFLKLIIDSAENSYPLWYGFTLVATCSLISLIKFMIMSRGMFYGSLAYLNIQTLLMNVIYQKMLKISASARIKYSTGEIINLLSTDVERIRTFWFYMFDFVYTPIMISICLIGLSFTIGINVLYGISVLIAFFPINSILVKIATKCEERQMKLKDTRLKLMTDFLSGIKIIKFYAWEKSVQEHITNIRKKEVTQLKYAIICFSLMEISFNACPILATLASFVGYVIFQGHSLTPQVAFISLMLFSLMRFSVYRIPGLIQESVNAKISLKRIEKFLLEPETSEMINTMTPSNNDTIIQMKNANFTWNPDEEKTVLALKSLTFEIQKGELIGVIGRVGNGKSSFLSSICAELYQISGTFFRHPAVTVSLVSQEAWIQNLSLKNNILFGKPFEENLYQQTIYSCALKDDIKIFPAGDETEIGEKGLNLSGGQKARVALARAVYQNSDLYIFDDTLSAVDCHVGAHIFQEVIGNEGILKDKTRIFALNSIEILPKCDRIIVLKDGGIFDIGTFEELCFKKNTSFIDIIKELKTKDIEANETTNNKKLELKQKQEDNKNLKKSPALQKDFLEDPTSAQQPFANLIQDEVIASGKISFKIYYDYLRSFGINLALLYFFTLFILKTSIESFRQIWMAKWTSNFRNETNSINDTQSLGIYGLFGILSCFVSGCSAVILAFGAVKASKKLHNNLLFSLLRSPMQFFDTTPLGRILNRLSKDIEKIDNDVPQKLNYSTILLAEGAFYIISAIYVIPEIGIASIIAIIAVIFVVRYYTYTSVQIRRLCSKAWSSVISHTQDSYVGINTLRAFGVQNRFSNYMIEKCQTFVESNLADETTSRWIQLRMDMLTSLFSLTISTLAIYFGHIGIIGTGSIALVISTGTMLSGLLAEFAKSIRDVEMSVVAVERVQEYANTEYENEWSSSLSPSPGLWPTKGVLQFQNFSMRYRPNTPLVLKNLNIQINCGEKIGIVGRTGAGKTSLTMALFRLIEPSEGTIIIDGIDFRRLGLHELRRALTIIPQDPVLFCGNLRTNLDPFEEFSDVELWNAIEKAHLRKFVDQFAEKLNHEISEGGGNLSVGQRQLICLARAILRKQTKILVLDEATAAVDIETDQLIQDSIRTIFSKCTILTIAHRLNTILDYDKVLVMDFGEIKEFDSPQKLLSNKNSLFYSLASQANIV